MRHILMMRGARTLVETCARLKAGESVLVVTDMEMMEVAEPVAAAAYERGAEVVIAIMPPRTADGQEPPRSVAAAMAQADVVFTPVGVSITHTHAVAEAVAAGARGLMLTGFTPDLLISGGLEADFVAQADVCERMAARFAGATDVHLTSAGGTDLTMSAAGRRGNALTCIVESGRFSTVPTIEANFSPLEGSAQGTIVADASVPYIGIGVLEQPVRATVEDGFITGIEGGPQADQLAAALRQADDPNVYNVAELGVGLNPKCRMQGIMLEDEGVLGTVHIGIGTNITLGGHVKAALHYDLIMWQPTIVLDGQVVLERGQLRI